MCDYTIIQDFRCMRPKFYIVADMFGELKILIRSLFSVTNVLVSRPMMHYRLIAYAALGTGHEVVTI